MISTLRLFQFVFWGGALSLLVSGCSPSPTIRLSASPGETPGITMGPFHTGSASATSTITVESVNDFAGTVTLSASCCQEVVRNHWVPLGGPGKMVWGFSNNSLNIPAKGSGSSTLNLTALAVGYGKFLVQVVAKDQSGTTLGQTNVGVKVLPASEPRPSCQPSSTVEVLPLSVALNAEITAAETTPRPKNLVFAVYRATGPDTWKWTITEDGTLGPAQARIMLKNKVPWEKEVSTAGCSSVPKTALVQPGNTGTIIISESQDTTFIFRKPVCASLLCVTTQWQTVVVFADTAFWTVFGGRTHTFEWLKD